MSGWRVEKGFTKDVTQFIYDESGSVAVVSTECRSKDEINRTARLISAAPELLVLAKWVLETSSNPPSEDVDVEIWLTGALSNLKRAANLALNKAEGKE